MKSEKTREGEKENDLKINKKVAERATHMRVKT